MVDDELIPLLNDLCFAKGGHHVPEGFAERFVKLHNEDWRLAQGHWERAVAQVLNTDAVERDARGAVAIRQAVTAAAFLSHKTDRCLVCVDSPDSLRWVWGRKA